MVVVAKLQMNPPGSLRAARTNCYSFNSYCFRGNYIGYSYSFDFEYSWLEDPRTS